jgi:predicted nucleic acid-binding protein
VIAARFAGPGTIATARGTRNRNGIVRVAELDEPCRQQQVNVVYDTLVAAQALCLGLTVVTNNTRHFGRVPGLAVENWA